MTNKKRKDREDHCLTPPYDPWGGGEDEPVVRDEAALLPFLGNFPDDLPRLSEIRERETLR